MRSARRDIAKKARVAIDERSVQHAAAFVRAVRDGIGEIPMAPTGVDRITRKSQAVADALYPAMKRALRSVISSRLRAFTADPFGVENTTAARFMKFQAFVISQLEGERVTEAFLAYAKDHLHDAIKRGLSNAQWMDEIAEASGLGEISRWHAVTVLRTNMATAYSASVIYDWNLAGIEAFPAWEFLAIDDAVVRPEHLELNGRIYPATDTSNFPPIGFNCRCVGSPISREELNAEKYAIEGQSAPVSEDFRNNAVMNFTAFAREHSDIPGVAAAIEEFEK